LIGEVGMGQVDTIGDRAVRLMKERLARLRKREAELQHDPSPETVHQLRVATRRLQAVLTTFRPVLELPSDVRRRPLRRVERRLGRLRDLDVLSGALDELADPSLSAPALMKLGALQQHLVAQRPALVRRAELAVGRRGFRRLLARLGDWLEAPSLTATAGFPCETAAPDLLLPRLARVLLHPGWRLPSLPPPGAPEAATLHALRRRVKTLRYGVECFETLYGEPVTTWLAELHEIQDALGRHHDASVLLEQLPPGVGSSDLRERVVVTAGAAVAGWSAWQARYDGTAGRTGLRLLLSSPPPAAPPPASSDADTDHNEVQPPLPEENHSDLVSTQADGGI